MKRAAWLSMLLLVGCGGPVETQGDVDAGTTQQPATGADAGPAVDAGASADAGTAPDAGSGVDAGPSAGVDAGPATPQGAVARAIVADGGRLVDVRTLSEFNAGHIDGARHLPLAELPARMGELEPKDEWVVVYCRSGNRSRQAANLLTDGGFTQVYDLGPMSAW